MTYSPKNITYSKAGVTLTCPVCQDSDTYQIGKLDREKWAVEPRTKHYWCLDCRAKKLVSGQYMEREPEDIDKLMELI